MSLYNRSRPRRPKKGTPRSKDRFLKADPVQLYVEKLGTHGDGIAHADGKTYYIPDTLPGDTILAQPLATRGNGFKASLSKILEASGDRISPLCQHVPDCGGCALQHFHHRGIAEFKRSLLIQALARMGLDTSCVSATRSIGPGTRRRLRLTTRRLQNLTLLGFNSRGSGTVVDLRECVIARKELTSLFPDLRKLITRLDSLGSGGDIQLTRSDTGTDLLLIPQKAADLSLKDRLILQEFAQTHDIARIAWDEYGVPEPVIARRQPRINWDSISIDLPIGAFLQPSVEGETVLKSLAFEGLAPSIKHIADLYAGCGTFSIPLARQGFQVSAYENAESSVKALRHAAASLQLTAEVRDLARTPLTPKELNRFDAVLFDPPRAGAASQAAMLSQSDVPCVIAVSCNPASLAKDLHTLIKGGYYLEKVTPVDQFTWSAHLEAVAFLKRHNQRA